MTSSEESIKGVQRMLGRIRMITNSWIILCLAILITSAFTGSACAAFLLLLDFVTAVRQQHELLILLLPVAGVSSGLMYSRWGSQIEAGNVLVFEEIRQPKHGIAFRITPMVLVGTLMTHLFGGSAGREGTAVQMAAGIGDLCRRWFGVSGTAERSLLLQAAVAAGFSGVFGTPAAGALFALEVLRRQKFSTAALPVCLVAAVIGDQTCLALGASHTEYSIQAGLLDVAAPVVNLFGTARIEWIIAAAISGTIFGAAAILFCALTHQVAEWSKIIIRRAWLRPAIGGMCVSVIYLVTGRSDYLGLGVESFGEDGVSIVSSFRPSGAETGSWIWKLVLTSVTVGSGFKGGEVTPLFFIGATLGNTLAAFTGMPTDLFAALGFVSLFAAATRTPVASLMMSVELFGGEYLICFAIAICAAVAVSGNFSIYHSHSTLLTKNDPEI